PDGLELGRGSLVNLAEPLELVSKMDEFLGAERCLVVAAPRPTRDVHGCGQPVAVPIVGLIRMLTGEHVDSHVLRIVVAHAKGAAHLLRERLAVWLRASSRRPKLQSLVARV